MSGDEDALSPGLERLSMDTTANINEDITWALEFSGDSPNKKSESVFSSYRTSIDGNSNISNAFNILKQGAALDDDRTSGAFSPLGPNSIFELTTALDVARVRLNRGLKHQVTLNGGATTVYNLTKPSTRDIPQIQLLSLEKKVPSAQITESLIKNADADYKSFERGYKALTEDVLSQFTQLHLRDDDAGSDAQRSDLDENLIPAVYADPDFRLDDQRVFRQVMENSRILPDPDTNDDMQIINNTKVQEKLSGYLDTVEVQLIHEISKTSDSFFTTLGEIQNIKNQSSDCIAQFHTIMAKLDDIEEGQAKTGIKILDLLDERRSVCYLESSVLQVKLVMEGFSLASAYFNQQRNIDCLNQILIVENLIKGVERDDYQDPDTIAQYPKFEYPVVDLTGLPALRGVRKDLEGLKHACSKGYIVNFVDLLLHNLRSHYNSVPPKDTMNRIFVSVDRARRYSDRPVNRLYTEIDPQVKENLSSFIKNLSKSGHLVQAFAEYEDKIILEIKAIIRNVLPAGGKLELLQTESLSNSESRASSQPESGRQTPIDPAAIGQGPNGGLSLSAKIKNLSGLEFNNMMKRIYAGLSECLRRLTIHQKLLLDLSLTALSPALAQDIDVMSLDITNAINKAIELTQVRLVKILNVRLEQLGDLPVADYLKLFLYSSAYLLECEFINPGYNATGPGSSLNEWVKNHVGYYIHRFHSSSVKRLASTCDRETWKEFTDSTQLSQTQVLLDELLGYAKFVETDGSEGWDGRKWSETLLNFYEDDQESNGTESQDNTDARTRLNVGENAYLVPEFILNVVSTTRDYVVLSKIFPSRSSTIMSNILTYFKVMNSRISQAILNAGATRTAGLRHITTKHLALCIQTVEFNKDLLQHAQHIFKNQQFDFDLSQQAVEEQTFVKTINNYGDHEKELFSKLVSIMHDRTLSHCATIIKLDLSQPLVHPQQCHPYMETLVKETSTVAKVLHRYLGDVECQLILLQIFDNYKKLLVSCFCTELPQFKDFNEKHSLLKDIDYFRVKLSEIPGYGNSGQVIWENVNSLPTIEDAKMEEIMRNNIEGERSAAAAASARTSKELSEARASEEVQKPATEETPATEEKPATDEEPTESEVPSAPQDEPKEGEDKVAAQEKSSEGEEQSISKEQPSDETKTEKGETSTTEPSNESQEAGGNAGPETGTTTDKES